MPASPRLGKLFGVALLIALIAGCAIVAERKWEEKFGAPATVDRTLTGPAGLYAAPEYYRDVKPIFDRRCVVCHGCYDAPCQLKLTSFSGIDRGASPQKVYDGARLMAADLSRLFIDAQSADEWRQKGFYPVLNENRQDADTNLAASTLYQMLELKRQHPLPAGGPLPASFDFALDRHQQCTRAENFTEFARNYPLWGMPYGMPAIADQDYATIKRWLETGAKAATPPPLDSALAADVQRWEKFFNGDSLQQQLMSRYLYEHLYLGDLYFDDPNPESKEHSTNTQYFKLVRSRTPPGAPTRVIATRRPYDDPGVARVYYRLEPIYSTMLVKSHMPYALNEARMYKWQDWFLRNDFAVSELPAYTDDIASNPFKAFRDLPVRSRYRFMLDEAQFTIMGFIKGPVCRGQIALNVINDQFWVVFIDPDAPALADEGKFLAEQSDNLRMPAAAESNASALLNWRTYSQAEKQYMKNKSAYLDRVVSPGGPKLTDIWNGDGNNQNAALTVFRHFDSATVVKGFVGDTPKTAWVVSYALLERIHYLLVAGYDVYGNLGHQLMTRMYMDFLRMEGEFNFLAFLPQQDRLRESRYWYRNVSDDVADYVYGPDVKLDRETGVVYRTDDPKRELLDQLKTYLGPALSQRWTPNLPPELPANARGALTRLEALGGTAVSHLPQISILRLHDGDRQYVFTLVHNNGHANVSTLLFEQSRLLPEEDNVSVVPGVLGAYPGAFFDIDAPQLSEFVASIAQIGSDKDYEKLVDRFGVRRNASNFWAYSDWLHTQLQKQSPIEAGVLDYNRLENR